MVADACVRVCGRGLCESNHGVQGGVRVVSGRRGALNAEGGTGAGRLFEADRRRLRVIAVDGGRMPQRREDQRSQGSCSRSRQEFHQVCFGTAASHVVSQ
jgi:hypothetical protein